MCKLQYTVNHGGLLYFEQLKENPIARAMLENTSDEDFEKLTMASRWTDKDVEAVADALCTYFLDPDETLLQINPNSSYIVLVDMCHDCLKVLF